MAILEVVDCGKTAVREDTGALTSVVLIRHERAGSLGSSDLPRRRRTTAAILSRNSQGVLSAPASAAFTIIVSVAGSPPQRAQAMTRAWPGCCTP